MSDPTEDSAVDATSELSDTISRSMGTVWQRHTGERPDSVSTEISLDQIRCVINGPEAPKAAADDAETAVTDDDVALLTVSAQRNEAIESVRRATHRRVIGFVSKRDKDAGISTQTFILDGRVKRR